ncbi:glutathione S-transferase family protein [Amphritea sp. HPY]|uniref:glutathione S-transferase family protein n=1 Tax=Amphritea sp. HPY TaxID=3421652 RepID=UPI003D7EF347
MITLYQRQDCPFCWRVRLILSALDLEYRSVDIALGEKHPDILAISPQGRSSVPVLIDPQAELVIWESSVIISYLMEQYAGDAECSEDNAADNARIAMINSYADSALGSAIKDTIFEKRAKTVSEWDRDLLEQSDQRWRSCCCELNRWFEQGLCSAKPIQLAVLGTRLALAQAYGLQIPRQQIALRCWFEAFVRSALYRQTLPRSIYWQGECCDYAGGEISQKFKSVSS